MDGRFLFLYKIKLYGYHKSIKEIIVEKFFFCPFAGKCKKKCFTCSCIIVLHTHTHIYRASLQVDFSKIFVNDNFSGLFLCISSFEHRPSHCIRYNKSIKLFGFNPVFRSCDKLVYISVIGTIFFIIFCR